MSTSPTEIQIALGIITSGPDTYWLERRPDAKHLAGLLAFPGGKCGPDESPFSALRRELFEELGIDVDEAELLIEIPWVYAESKPAKHLRLWVYRVTAWQGEIRGGEGQYLTQARLDCRQRQGWQDDLPPANRGIVAGLCLPTRVAISAACGLAGGGIEQWWRDLAETARDLARRFGVSGALLQLRPGRDLTLAEWQRAVDVVRDQGIAVFVNADLGLAAAVGADGIHLNRTRLVRVDRDKLAAWQAAGGWVTAAVHHPAEMARANDVRADAVLVSPVQPTASHLDVPALGWDAFAALARTATMPAYALGGMTLADLQQARLAGGQGIAAIRAFWCAGGCRSVGDPARKISD
ncbi:MAG: thiamine phosphate synthase [Halothiobacillus sp.]|jgi:8-oxo-dGTP diphosphatase|nr:thiamine phosphate synthase [Halothiobacillus sp.]